MEVRENVCIDVSGDKRGDMRGDVRCDVRCDMRCDMRGNMRDHLFNVCDICFRIGKALTCACERVETARLHTSFVVGRPT